MIKKKIKFKNKKLLIGIIIGLTLGISTTALATTLLYSSDVTYDNSSSGLSSTNLQDALDELYEQASSCPVCDSEGNCTVTCPNGLSYVATSTGYKCRGLTTGEQLLAKVNVVTSGNGLYVDSATNGRYIYRGASVDNYITFNDETWRIISVESDDTIKIIRNEQLSSTQAWDTTSNRNKYTSTYCASASEYGCNAWAATFNLVGAPSTFIQGSYSGTVIKDASLNTYLNETYYSNLSSTAKAKVVKGTFNVSTPGSANDTETLEVDAEQEKQYQWQGYVALATITEYLRASIGSGCASLKAGENDYSTSPCKSNNWLWPTFNTHSMYEFTLSPFSSYAAYDVWHVNSRGFVSSLNASGSVGVRPVLHLSSDITLSGSGTESDPYIIN